MAFIAGSVILLTEL